MEGKISQILSVRNWQFCTPRIEIEKESDHTVFLKAHL